MALFRSKRRIQKVQDYANPLFPRQQEQKPRVWLRWLVGVVVLGIIVAGYIVVTRYTISHIKVEGTTRILQTDILSAAETALSDRRFFIFQERHLLVASEEELAARIEAILREDTAVVEGVQAKKQFPNTLLLTITERQHVSIYETAGTAYLLGADGVIVQALAEDALDVPTRRLVDPLGLQVRLGDKVAPQSLIDALSPVDAALRSMDLAPKRFLLQDVSCPLPKEEVPEEGEESEEEKEEATNTNEGANVNVAPLPLPLPEETEDPCIVEDLLRHSTTLVVETERGFLIRFETRELIPEQIERLRVFQSDVLKGSQPRSYIDLRFSDYVYYR